MKNLIIILSLLIIYSCNRNPSGIQKYNSLNQFSSKRNKIIKLESTELNFMKITEEIYKSYDKKLNLIIEFEDKGIKKQIKPHVYLGGLIKEKNILRVSFDSILIDNNYPISEIKSIMKRHYSNNGKIPYYPDNTEKAIIELALDTTKTAIELKQTLNVLTKNFDDIKKEIKGSFELNILFNYTWKYSAPIPPPPEFK